MGLEWRWIVRSKCGRSRQDGSGSASVLSIFVMLSLPIPALHKPCPAICGIVHFPSNFFSTLFTRKLMRRTKASSFKQTCWIATLILSQVFAQFAGLRHRIEHAGWQGSQGFSKLDAQLASKSESRLSSDSGTKNSSHSCAAFDASTMADTFDATPCTVVLADTENSAAQSISLASWDAPVVHRFLSRAPPPVAI